jgi:hypothetical protein
MKMEITRFVQNKKGRSHPEMVSCPLGTTLLLLSPEPNLELPLALSHVDIGRDGDLFLDKMCSNVKCMNYMCIMDPKFRKYSIQSQKERHYSKHNFAYLFLFNLYGNLTNSNIFLPKVAYAP